MKATYRATVTSIESGVRAMVIVGVRHWDSTQSKYRHAQFEVYENDQPRVGEDVTITIESDKA